MRNFFTIIIFQIARRAVIVAGLVLMLLVLLIVADVTLRRVFNSPLTFSYEIIGFGLVIVIWGAILYSTSQERHISIDVLVSHLSAKIRQFLRLIFDLVSAVVFFLIGWQSISYAIKSRNLHQASPILDLPIYFFIFIVALGSILAGLILLIIFIDSIRGKGKW